MTTLPPPVRIKGLHHIALSVPSIDQALDFYCGAFGFDVVDHEHLPRSEEGDRVTQLHGVECTVAMLHAGNLFIELFEFHGPPPRQIERRLCDFGMTHLSFEVEDVHDAFAKLQAHGVEWHCSPIDAGDGYLMTYGRDPFGNVIEIQQVPEPRPYAFARLSSNP